MPDTPRLRLVFVNEKRSSTPASTPKSLSATLLPPPLTPMAACPRCSIVSDLASLNNKLQWLALTHPKMVKVFEDAIDRMKRRADAQGAAEGTHDRNL